MQQEDEQRKNPGSSSQQPSRAASSSQQSRRSRASDWATNTLSLPVSQTPDWQVTGPPAPKKVRFHLGHRRPVQQQQQQEQQQQQQQQQPAAETIAADDGAIADWLAAEAGGDGASPEPEAAASSGSFAERAARVPDPRAAARSAEQQMKWDSARAAMQRRYVEQLPAMHALGEQRIQAERTLLEIKLAAQVPSCPCCGGSEMQPLAPVPVLYVGTELRFHLEAPVHACCAEGCSGRYAPSPFSIGCFPLTPKVSWDITQASPVQPARWVDLRLLRLCDSIIFTGGRSASVHGLVAAVHRCHELNGCTTPLAFDHLKRQIGEAIMEYGYLDCKLMDLSSLGVAGLPAGPLARCPCCYRGSVHINADFCFGLCHFARCGTASVELQPPNTQLFLHSQTAAELVRQANNRGSAAAAAQAEADRACSDFNAASAMARTSEKCDVTAVGSTMCRHAIVAHIMDISTGERYIYAAVMLYTLMVCCTRVVAVVWYDINCKFGRWFKCWAAAQNALSAVLERTAVLFPLPCFHRYSHSAPCQERNAGVHMPGTALQYHEPNETLWACLAVLGITTQYMTHRNRWGRLERGAQLYNERQADRIVPRLQAMRVAAERTRQQAASGLTSVLQQLSDCYDLTEAQAQERVVQRALDIEAHAQQDLKPPPLAEYARLRLCSAHLAPRACTAPLPLAIDIFTGSAENLADRDSAALAKHEGRLRALGRQVFPDGEPALDSAAFVAAVAALATFEINRLQTWLQRSAQQVQLMEALIISLTGRPGEQGKTRSSKQRLQSRMQRPLSSLRRWLSGGYVGFELLPSEVRACSASVANSQQWTVAAICRGAYPWEASAATGPSPSATPTAATLEQLITSLRTRVNEMQRAGEELALLAEERGRCMEYLQLRQAEISAALARCQQRTAALLGGSPVPDCSSFASRTPASEAARCLELQYSLGLESLLTKALEKAAAQLSIATTAFGVNSGSGGGSAEDAGCDYECIDEEDEVI